MIIRRKWILLLALTVVAPVARGDLVTWLHARLQDLRILDGGPYVKWERIRNLETVQNSKVIRLGEPVRGEGRLVLPVEYVVTEPSSYFGWGRAVISRKGNELRLRIERRPGPEIRPEDRGRIHQAVLPQLEPGTYAIFYETAGDPEKSLGTVVIR